MQVPIKNAPFTGKGYTPSDGITLDITENGKAVTLAVANVPFVPSWLTVGKEYAGVNLMSEAQEYPCQTVLCVPDPDGNPEYLPACGSDTWDSVIDYANLPGINTIVVPFNQFKIAAAFNTDGIKRQYYIELVTADGSQRCKFVFDYTTPIEPIFPGYPLCSPAPPPPEPVSPGKGKGHGKK